MNQELNLGSALATWLMCTTALLAGCGSPDRTDISPTTSSASGEPQPVELGLGTVDGLPGTPLKMSENGLPLIEGVERPDYAEDGINSFANRAERVTAENPTGEYRFMLDGTADEGPAVDAPLAAGFSSQQEKYNYCLVHECAPEGSVLGTATQPFVANVYFGQAFDIVNGGPSMRGACWTQENAGKDCEFPSKVKFTWAMIDPSFGPQFSTFFGCAPKPQGQGAPLFYNPPQQFAQEGFNLWKPEAVISPANFGTGQFPISDGSEFMSVFCDDLPGAFFGGIMGATGGFGPLTRRVTNAKDAYPSCSANNLPGPSAFPHGLYTWANSEMRFDPDNLYQRLQACGGTAKLNDVDGLHIASVNMFAHEAGHALGFSHFGTGIMAQGGSCTTFYLQQRTVPSIFHQAVASYNPSGGTFNFVPGASCNSNLPLLPVPQPNSTTQPVPGNGGNLEQ